MGWAASLLSSLQTEVPTCSWSYNNESFNGATVEDWAGLIDATLAETNIPQLYFLINLGVNQMGIYTESDFKTDYQYIIDAIHAKWPVAKIYMVKPWRRDYDAQAATTAGWIDDLIAANAGVCYAGHDEQVWLKGADNGATMTIDGTHYSTAGHAECPNQWMPVLGY